MPIAIRELRRFAHRAVSNDPTKFIYEPKSLCAADKIVGEDQPLSRVLPPDQGLNANCATGRNIDLRLIVHHELIAIECILQFLSPNHVRKARVIDLQRFGFGESLQYLPQFIDLEWLLEVTHNGKTKDLRQSLR